MIVIDASALAAIVLREPTWRELVRYLRRAVSVDYVVKEVANAIWRATYVRKILSIDDARYTLSILYKLVNTNIELYPELDLVPQAMEIAFSKGIALYDALYIALAIDRRIPLLSLDEKQRRVARELGSEVLP